jgi:hypothetical protein
MIKSRRIRLAGNVARMGRRGMRVSYWWVSPKERELGRPRRRSVDSITIYLGYRGWGGMDWIDLAQIETGGGLF